MLSSIFETDGIFNEQIWQLEVNQFLLIHLICGKHIQKSYVISLDMEIFSSATLQISIATTF